MLLSKCPPIFKLYMHCCLPWFHIGHSSFLAFILRLDYLSVLAPVIQHALSVTHALSHVLLWLISLTSCNLQPFLLWKIYIKGSTNTDFTCIIHHIGIDELLMNYFKSQQMFARGEFCDRVLFFNKYLFPEWMHLHSLTVAFTSCSHVPHYLFCSKLTSSLTSH